MPTFYQRPVTWLFWIAAACLDLVALSLNYEGAFATSLALGQLFVASGWLVLGKSHPLTRATWFVVAIAALVAPDFVIPRLRTVHYHDLVWPHVLGLMIAAGIFTAMATGGWFAILWGVSNTKPEPSPAKLQFSLAILFGWMIVLAVASTGLRIADFSLIDDDPKDLFSGCGLAFAAATMIAAALGEYQVKRLTRSLSLLGVLTGIIMAFAAGLPQDAAAVAIGAWTFVAAWIVAVRLDGRLASTPLKSPVERTAATQPALRLFADER